MNTLNLDITKTVCFTGHRPKDIIKTNPYDETSRNQYQKLVDYTVTRINALIDQGYINFISGGAQGFDQLAFWAVNKAKKTTLTFRISYIYRSLDKNPAGQKQGCSVSMNTS